MNTQNFWKSSQGVIVYVYPFFDYGYGLKSLEMKESIGGEIASGHIEMINNSSQGAVDLITETQYISILVKNEAGGLQKEIKDAVISRKSSFNSQILGVDFVCAPGKDFYSKPETTSWDNPETAIFSDNGLFSRGRITKNCDCDMSGDIPILQRGETNYALLTRLAMSYKKKAVFVIGFNGLLVKDVPGKTWTQDGGAGENDEPYWVVTDTPLSAKTRSRYELNYNPRTYWTEVDPWEEMDNEVKSVNIRTTLLGTGYHLVGTKYVDLLDNYRYNQNLYSSSLYQSLDISHFGTVPSYQTGDVVLYRRKADGETGVPYDVYLVAAQSFRIVANGTGNLPKKGAPGNQFIVLSTLMGLKESGVIFNETDPHDTL